MKILHVITSLHTGGAEKLMVELLPRFRSAGHDAELLLFDGSDTPFYRQLRDNGIKIHRLSTGGNVYNLGLILKTRKYLPEYDIIHTHNTACQYFVAIASRLVKHRGKLVTTEHNTTNRRRSLPMFRHIDRFMYGRYDSIIAIAQSTADNLSSFVGGKLPIHVINNGVDISRYWNHDSSKIDCNGQVIVTMVAAFRCQKNQDTLIRALRLLPERFSVWLVGDGERREALEALVSELNVKDRVKFLGIRTDIPEIMRKSHIMVLSSHWEGLSLSSVEGCASGRPMIASDVPGLREIVGGAGILFPDNDHEALAHEIAELTSDKSYYDITVNRCLDRAKRYDIETMAKNYLSLYESLTEQHNPTNNN